MPYFLDAIYLSLLLLASPYLIYKALTTGKYRRGLWQRFLGRSEIRNPKSEIRNPRIWFHGVSVGEVHLLRGVVAAFRKRHPDGDCVISTTTDTGFEEARRLFSDLTVIRWPLDFSWAVGRALNEVRPDLIVLAESELWPNFLACAKRKRIPVAVINMRMSPRSLRRWQRVRLIAKRLFALVEHFAVQTVEYAENLRKLGVPPAKLTVTGSVKYDGVLGVCSNPKTASLRELLNIGVNDLVWIAGSTQAPEEEIALAIFRNLRDEYQNLRLILVPRQRERFDEVANLLERSGMPFLRRSELPDKRAHVAALPSRLNDVILVDTIGELGALWGLADAAFVGGSLDGKRGGQNMIEPAAFGAAVLFGPHTWNFRDTVRRLREAKAALEVRDADELATAVRRLLGDAGERGRLGAAARALVQQQQGATQRTLNVLDNVLASTENRRHVA